MDGKKGSKRKTKKKQKKDTRCLHGVEISSYFAAYFLRSEKLYHRSDLWEAVDVSFIIEFLSQRKWLSSQFYEHFGRKWSFRSITERALVPRRRGGSWGDSFRVINENHPSQHPVRGTQRWSRSALRTIEKKIQKQLTWKMVTFLRTARFTCRASSVFSLSGSNPRAVLMSPPPCILPRDQL